MNPVRGIVFSALFGALMVVMSFVQFNLGFTPVPITLENMGVMLAGAFLGATYGFISIFAVVALAALGIPLLHGSGGIPFILGPTGGFIWMFPVSALLIGWLVSRIRGNDLYAYIKTFAAILGGSLIVYITGVPWLAYKLQVSFGKAMGLGCYPYLLGDALKAAAAAVIVLQIRRIYPMERLLGSRTANVVDLNKEQE